MRDLFLQCAYVSVMLRNVNLKSPSEYQFVLMPESGQDTGCVHYMMTSGCRFLATEDGEGGAAGPLRCMYLWSQVHKRVLNAADGWRLRDQKSKEVSPQ